MGYCRDLKETKDILEKMVFLEMKLAYQIVWHFVTCLLGRTWSPR